MPHLILSVSQQLASHKTTLLNAAHQAMLDSVLTVNQDVKSRVSVLDDFIVGDHCEEAFVHAEVRLLRKPERTNEAQKVLADAILAALYASLPKLAVPAQLSCEMVVMNTDTYGKQRIDHH